MPLIIPEAQSEASIIQQPRISPAAADMSGVAALGDTFVNIGAKKVQAENDRTVRQARLTAMQELDAARLKFETTGDLENLTANWEAEAKAITARVAEAVPVHLRKDFQIGMDEMVAPQTSAIRRREFALFQDRETAALNADLRGYEKAAAAAPTPEAKEKIFAEMAAGLGRAVDNGILSAVEADRMLADIPANTAQIEAKILLEEDPAAYLERADEFAGLLPPDAHADNSIIARRLVDAAAAQKARADELAASALDKELSRRADDAIKVIEGGLPYKGLPALLEDLKGTPYRDLVMGAVDAASEGGNFAMLPASRRSEIIKERKSSPTGNPADVARLNRLEEMDKRLAEAESADLLGSIRERQIHDVPPVNIADQVSVNQRRDTAEAAYAQFTPGAATIRYFDQAEADRLGAILSGNDPDAALGVIANIVNTFDDAAPAALAQLGEKDPIGLMAGALVLETGDPQASRMMLTGRKMKADGKGAAVSAEVRKAAEAELAPLFPATPDGKARLTTLLDGMDLHYAAAGIGIEDPKSDLAKGQYLSGGYALMAEQDWGKGQKTGGVQEVHGVRAILPAGVSARDVELALISNKMADAWKRASLTGGLPQWGMVRNTGPRGQPVKGRDVALTSFSSEDRQRITVLSLGSGLYALGYLRDDGTTGYLRDPSSPDGMFRFDMNLLLKGVSAQ